MSWSNDVFNISSKHFIKNYLISKKLIAGNCPKFLHIQNARSSISSFASVPSPYAIARVNRHKTWIWSVLKASVMSDHWQLVMAIDSGYNIWSKSLINRSNFIIWDTSQLHKWPLSWKKYFLWTRIQEKLLEKSIPISHWIFYFRFNVNRLMWTPKMSFIYSLKIRPENSLGHVFCEIWKFCQWSEGRWIKNPCYPLMNLTYRVMSYSDRKTQLLAGK